MASTRKAISKAAAAQPPERTPEQKAMMALQPTVNSAVVMGTFQANLMGAETDMSVLVTGLRGTCDAVHGGDLQLMEQMLVSQAAALQTIFASLARKAANQEHLRQYEAFMGLALKAQSQSRSTILALVELRHPKQALFVRQANIAHGAQQVNNGTPAPADATASRTEEPKPGQNKLLEADHGQPGNRLDTGAQTAPARGNPAVEAMAEVHRADQR